MERSGGRSPARCARSGSLHLRRPPRGNRFDKVALPSTRLSTGWHLGPRFVCPVQGNGHPGSSGATALTPRQLRAIAEHFLIVQGQQAVTCVALSCSTSNNRIHNTYHNVTDWPQSTLMCLQFSTQKCRQFVNSECVQFQSPVICAVFARKIRKYRAKSGKICRQVYMSLDKVSPLLASIPVAVSK